MTDYALARYGEHLEIQRTENGATKQFRIIKRNDGEDDAHLLERGEQQIESLRNHDNDIVLAERARIRETVAGWRDEKRALWERKGNSPSDRLVCMGSVESYNRILALLDGEGGKPMEAQS